MNAARSAGQNQGATFRLRLPLAEVADSAADAARRTGQAAASASPRALKILLVEDHGDTALMTVKLLAHEGHDVRTAGDAAAALQAIEQGQFDLLISDLGLPDRSGLELMRELQQRGRTLPAIALSGYGQQSDIERTRAAGFLGHLVKPVDPSALLELVGSFARTIICQ